ncbi:type II toxin-antitoxin system Phd/YefM family antitoxin [Iningainema tapete]|uniref:Antitoxin n=1 Tax=Iningainema tapete BLCC-T55 TaxID=2748662 RepID=A0A8J7BZK0_9CYAN|nr:type II toxin-antitoxin system Phd/YefM family antitoxin [Iningainema tapete]MBD2776058.1 type II toxin-antitoxin system Phd/YefM family antitoxin [Iningainema tapete BLCC-T55]
MKTVTIDEIKANFSEYLKQSQSEPILIIENGRPVAAINVVVDAEELERLSLAHNSQFNQLLETAEQSIQETGGIKHDDFWKLVDG